MAKLLSFLVLFVMLTLLVPTGLVLASQNSVQGETMYPVKRTLEQGILVLASLTPWTKAYFQVDFSGRRYKEAKTLLANGKNAYETLNELVAESTDAATSIDNVSLSQRQKLRAQLIAQLEATVKTLQDQAPTAVAQTIPTPTSKPTSAIEAARQRAAQQQQQSQQPAPQSSSQTRDGGTTIIVNNNNNDQRLTDLQKRVQELLDQQNKKKDEDKVKINSVAASPAPSASTQTTPSPSASTHEAPAAVADSSVRNPAAGGGEADSLDRERTQTSALTQASTSTASTGSSATITNSPTNPNRVKPSVQQSSGEISLAGAGGALPDFILSATVSPVSTGGQSLFVSLTHEYVVGGGGPPAHQKIWLAKDGGTAPVRVTSQDVSEFSADRFNCTSAESGSCNWYLIGSGGEDPFLRGRVVLLKAGTYKVIMEAAPKIDGSGQPDPARFCSTNPYVTYPITAGPYTFYDCGSGYLTIVVN